MKLLRTLGTLIRRRHAEVLWQHDPEPCELFHGFRTFCWGLWVLNPWHPLFAGAPQTGAWLRHLAPDWIWGGGTVFLGLWVLLGIAVGTYRSRRAAQFLQFLCWTTVTLGTFLADPASGLWSVHAVTALCCAWVYLRIGRYAHARD